MAKLKTFTRRTAIITLGLVLTHFAACGFLIAEGFSCELGRIAWRHTGDWIAPAFGLVPRSMVPSLVPVDIDDVIAREAERYNLPEQLLRAQIHVESGGNPAALSKAGACGIAQIMPFNYKRCGWKGPAQCLDVEDAVRCQAKIDREEIDVHRSLTKGLKAYNGGTKCVKNRCEESEAYVEKVLNEMVKRG